MSAQYLVWRLCDGHSNASTFEAYDHEDAATRAHDNDFEYDDEEIFCVQAVAVDRKVRVVTVEREMVPKYRGKQFRIAQLKAKCTCGKRLFDADGIGTKCRRCWVREQAAQIDAWQKERAQ